MRRDFEKDGFVHLSYAPQVNAVADLIYSETPNLKLLTIDPSKLTAKVLEEKADYPAELFPHLYGPLNIDAVISVRSYGKTASGKFPVVHSE